MLSCYDEADQAAAWRCIERSGGVDALHLQNFASRGFYDDGTAWADLADADRAARGEPYWHVWRIEGPGSVLYFRGWPHVHASIHVADDAGANQHVGEVLAETRVTIEGEGLRSLLQDALRQASGEAIAFYPWDVLPAKLYPGPVTTGLVWSLDPYDDEWAVAEVRGETALPDLRGQIEAQTGSFDPTRTYRVAGFAYPVSNAYWMGAEPVSVERSGVKMRGVLEAYFREHGLRRLERS